MRNPTILLTMTISLAACVNYDAETSYQTKIIHEPGAKMSPKYATEQESLLMDMLIDFKWERPSMMLAMSEAYVVVKAQPFPCVGNEKAQCLGQQDYNFLNVSQADCVSHTSLAHEMFHWFQWRIQGKVDYDHTSPEWKRIDSIGGTCPEL